MRTDSLQRRLRVNADDFGFTPGVTDGILEAHDRGIVTHTSIMAGGLDFERAAALAGKRPGLGVGVHLTLTWGRPVSPPSSVPSLMGPDQRFPPLGGLLKRFLKGRLAASEVMAEWRAQMERVTNAGITPTHVDSHHHIHLLPGLLPGAVQIAREFGAPWLRKPKEPILTDLGNAFLKRLVFRMLTVRLWPLPSGDAFRGITLQGKTDFLPRLRRAIRELPAGTTEFMVHPGHPDTVLSREDTYVRERAVELEALCDPGVKMLLRDQGIELERRPSAAGAGSP